MPKSVVDVAPGLRVESLIVENAFRAAQSPWSARRQDFGVAEVAEHVRYRGQPRNRRWLALIQEIRLVSLLLTRNGVIFATKASRGEGAVGKKSRGPSRLAFGQSSARAGFRSVRLAGNLRSPSGRP